MAGRHQERHSSGLLDDVEWNMLTGGLSKYHAHIVSLYEKYRAYSYVERFAERALPFIDMPSNSGTSSNNAALRTELLSRLFTATTAQSRFDRAHAVLTSMTESDPALQRSCLRRLVEKMCESSRAAELIALPFPGMQDLVDDALLAKCAAAQVTPAALTGTGNGTPYHQILYAWRISRGDFRGAAAVILDRIQKLRLASGGGAFNGVGGEAGDRMAATATLTAPDGADVLDTPITAHYLMLINALSCVDPAQAWVFAEDYASAGEAGHGKRTVLTLADIRKQYQDELDRIAAIQNNQFGFGGEDGLGDVMIVGT